MHETWNSSLSENRTATREGGAAKRINVMIGRPLIDKQKVLVEDSDLRTPYLEAKINLKCNTNSTASWHCYLMILYCQ